MRYRKNGITKLAGMDVTGLQVETNQLFRKNCHLTSITVSFSQIMLSMCTLRGVRSKGGREGLFGARGIPARSIQINGDLT